jgi:hypothetical protein
MCSQKTPANCELENALKSRISSLMTKEDLEHPYAWAARTGLSKGTFTGIWVQGRHSLHRATAEKISSSTGADVNWIQTGLGQPYPTNPAQPCVVLDTHPLAPQTSVIDKQILEISIETLETVLEATSRRMQPSKKAEVIMAIYQLYVLSPSTADLRPQVELLIRSAA